MKDLRRLTKTAGNPNDILRIIEEVTESVNAAQTKMTQLLDAVDNMDENIYEENYDLFRGFFDDMEQAEYKLSDISESLDKYSTKIKSI